MWDLENRRIFNLGLLLMVFTLSTRLPYSFFSCLELFFSKILSIYSLYISVTAPLPPLSCQSQPHKSLPHYPLPFSSEQGKYPLGYLSALVYQVSAGLHASSPMEAQPGSLASRRVSNDRQWSQTHLPFQYLGTHMKSKLHIYYKWVGCLGPDLTRSLVGVLCEHPWSQVDSVGILVMFLTPLAHSMLSPTLSQDASNSAWCLAVLSASVYISCGMEPL